MQQPVPKARLVISLLAGAEAPRVLALRRLVQTWGPLEYLSRPLDFAQTAYYASEMGPGLKRRLASFQDMLAPHRLAEVKTACQALEAELAQDGRRRVNLDPGLLSAHSLLLASGKAQGHRLPLAEGIWGELTLWYHHGEFHPLPWTYPDYAGREMRGLLKGLRARYLWQLKQDQAPGVTP